jgi:hypothetical protein
MGGLSERINRPCGIERKIETGASLLRGNVWIASGLAEGVAALGAMEVS